MTKTARQYITVIIIIIASSSSIFSQLESSDFQHSFTLKSKKSPLEKTRKSASVLPISIGVLTAVYLLNPIAEYTDKKFYLGITKELSVGWGKLGEYRMAFEYSMIFAGNIKHYVRLSGKYDILLADGIQPSHMLQGTGVVSAGGGYFTDFQGLGGIFPELTYGYSIRNHKLLFYPHVKIRHTFMFNKDRSDITDISFGIILGIANPFIDVDIKRRY
jgi:hypothetical protein